MQDNSPFYRSTSMSCAVPVVCRRNYSDRRPLARSHVCPDCSDAFAGACGDGWRLVQARYYGYDAAGGWDRRGGRMRVCRRENARTCTSELLRLVIEQAVRLAA